MHMMMITDVGGVLVGLEESPPFCPLVSAALPVPAESAVLLVSGGGGVGGGDGGGDGGGSGEGSGEGGGESAT